MTASLLVRTNPYPGLAPFQEPDAARFFGRDKEIEEILDRLASRRLLAVIGVSGCGKSSLVGAGVIPILRIGAAENLLGRWRIAVMHPGSAPLQSMRTALGAGPDWPATSFDLVEYARGMLQTNEKLLLIVDQFEELFRYRAETISKDGGNAAALFVSLLLGAVDQCEIPIYVLLTMRTDFLGECAQFRGLPEALNDSYYLVPRMTRLQQQEAIERPLDEQGVVMPPALVQQLLNDSADDPDHLPVLQHLLKRLWKTGVLAGRMGQLQQRTIKRSEDGAGLSMLMPRTSLLDFQPSKTASADCSSGLLRVERVESQSVGRSRWPSVHRLPVWYPRSSVKLFVLFKSADFFDNRTG